MADTTDYVDPKFGAAPSTGSWTLDPSKGWVALQGTPTYTAGTGSTQTGAGIITDGLKAGFNFVNYGGQQVLGNSTPEMNDLQTGADMLNKAQGSNLSAFEYDKMLNPSTYQARWNADGTPNTSATASTATQMGVGGSPAPAPAASGTSDGIGGGPGRRGHGTGASGSNLSNGMYGWNVTPDQTVEGRIQSIMNPNNPIIAMARSDAVDQMNARGLSDSSLATTAADRASYEAAIPIAQSDAATAAKAAGYNADIQNQSVMQGRQLSSQMGIAQLQADTQRYGYDTTAATQRYTADLNAKSQQVIATMDNTNRAQLQQMQNDNQRLLQTNSNAATAFNQSMVAVANIEQNDKMDASAKTEAIAQIMQNLQMQLTTLGKVSSIDLSGTLDFSSMPGFDASGKWVGFGGSAGGAAGGATEASGGIA